MHRLSGVLFGCLLPILVHAQGEIDTQEKILYRNERSLAFLLNSNGLGGNFRYAKRITYLKKTLYEVDVVNIKHPKEVKIYSNYNAANTSRSYVYGKTNTILNLRLGIGSQREIFQKQDRDGISIRYFYNFGPVIGFAKPIYYNYVTVLVDADDKPYYVTKTDKFIGQHPNATDIMGRASFFKGFDEISVIPGIYGKLGLTMEFGKKEQVINAIEGGIVFDAFIKRMPIMATEKNPWFFPSLFISYRFGKAIDVRERQQKKNKIDDLLIQ